MKAETEEAPSGRSVLTSEASSSSFFLVCVESRPPLESALVLLLPAEHALSAGRSSFTAPTERSHRYGRLLVDCHSEQEARCPVCPAALFYMATPWQRRVNHPSLSIEKYTGTYTRQTIPPETTRSGRRASLAQGIRGRPTGPCRRCERAPFIAGRKNRPQFAQRAFATRPRTASDPATGGSCRAYMRCLYVPIWIHMH